MLPLAQVQNEHFVLSLSLCFSAIRGDLEDTQATGIAQITVKQQVACSSICSMMPSPRPASCGISHHPRPCQDAVSSGDPLSCFMTLSVTLDLQRDYNTVRLTHRSDICIPFIFHLSQLLEAQSDDKLALQALKV